LGVVVSRWNIALTKHALELLVRRRDKILIAQPYTACCYAGSLE